MQTIIEEQEGVVKRQCRTDAVVLPVGPGFPVFKREIRNLYSYMKFSDW